MQNELQTDDPHLDSATLTQALTGSCGAGETDCSLEGLQCNDDECFVTTNEFEINPTA